MRLSEAIRLGAMMKPQAFGWILDYEGERTCALGSALDAAGVRLKPGSSRRHNTPAEWRLLMRRHARCPARHTKCDFCYPERECMECKRVQPLVAMIEHLNDDHKWSREAIADYVEKFEAQPAETPSELAEVET